MFEADEPKVDERVLTDEAATAAEPADLPVEAPADEPLTAAETADAAPVEDELAAAEALDAVPAEDELADAEALDAAPAEDEATDEPAPADAEPAEAELAAAETQADAEAPVEDEAAGEDEAAAEATDEPAPADAEPAPVDDRQWYVIHCYSGYENKVRHNLEQRIDSMGMKGQIFEVIVPTEEEIEVKDGKRRTVERRVFPGYILVEMIMTEESWYVVRNTPGVTGFVGMGNTPTPLRPEEVAQILKRMEAEAPKVKVTFKSGQKVRIVDGPFNDFIGTVAEIDMDRTTVRVMVSFFGRETPVELDFLQVEKV